MFGRSSPDASGSPKNDFLDFPRHLLAGTQNQTEHGREWKQHLSQAVAVDQWPRQRDKHRGRQVVNCECERNLGMSAMKFLPYRFCKEPEAKDNDCGGIEEEPEGCRQGNPPAVKDLGPFVSHFRYQQKKWWVCGRSCIAYRDTVRHYRSATWMFNAMRSSVPRVREI